MYGEGKTADNPQDAGALATPFYQNPSMAKSHFDAAMAKLKSFPQADATNMAAIGYCFGGSMALNMARMGEDLKGVISFHGGLAGVPLDKDLLKARVLVLHGNDDKFVSPEEVATFRHQMDSIGANYTFIGYPNATHAFTNPAATANGEKFNIPIAYNAAADTASFEEMKKFFGELFK
ncbi:MAG: dienelactone hydrolase family protein, partial [Nitrospirota bacterium]|nr:dienelactone hydrolase family protein [Nitrospirota bacterium]